MLTDQGSPGRYGCQEFRDDGERVIAGRAHPELFALFEAHRASCRACERHHQRLAAVYRPPRLPAEPNEFAREREFGHILARSVEVRQREREDERWQRLGVGVLGSAAAALALALLLPDRPPSAKVVADELEVQVDFGSRVHIPEGSLEHRAQSFGRIVAGEAWVSGAGGRQAANDSFAVGTEIGADQEDVQLALFGSLLANLAPGTRMTWAKASNEEVELELHHGLLALRYDRGVEDPILHVRTDSVLVRSDAGVITIELDADGAVVVAVLRGEAEVLSLADPLDPAAPEVLAQVPAGSRWSQLRGTVDDLGHDEVAAAMVVAEQSLDSPSTILAVPASWTVPGLPADPSRRTLEQLTRAAQASSRKRTRERSRTVPDAVVSTVDSRLWLDHAAMRERERKLAVGSELERCRLLYDDVDTRFRAARCLSEFTRDHGHEPEGVEALLMFGVLRMDYASDYPAAVRDFEEFLRRAPDHPQAELARYKLVLAAIETGAIELALSRARAYLHRHPDGQFLGRILLRFPELKEEL